MSTDSKLAVRTDSMIATIRKHNPDVADLIVSLGASNAKLSNPEHTTPNLALVILAIMHRVGSSGTYSNGGSQDALGRNRVVTKENDKRVSVVLSPTAQPILATFGKSANAGGHSFYSAVANAVQVPGMKQGPEDGFLRYLSAFTTEFGGSIPLDVFRSIADADRKVREAFRAANAPK